MPIPKMIPKDDSLYALVLLLHKEEKIQIGKLGFFLFPKGFYIYIGSAKGKMESRIKRHLKVEKKKHWHFDYLRPYGEVIKVITFPEKIGECHLREMLLKKNDELEMPIERFGSSDCKCPSHLLYTFTKEALPF